MSELDIADVLHTNTTEHTSVFSGVSERCTQLFDAIQLESRFEEVEKEPRMQEIDAEERLFSVECR